MDTKSMWIGKGQKNFIDVYRSIQRHPRNKGQKMEKYKPATALKRKKAPLHITKLPTQKACILCHVLTKKPLICAQMNSQSKHKYQLLKHGQ